MCRTTTRGLGGRFVSGFQSITGGKGTAYAKEIEKARKEAIEDLKTMRVVSLNQTNEEPFFEFLNRDRVLHIFTIFDLKHLRDWSHLWFAQDNGMIRGYVFEFKERYIHTHGDVESIGTLVDYINVVDPVFVIEPDHLNLVEQVFTPVEPTDPASQNTVTTYLVMKADVETFQPVKRHTTKKMGTEDLEDVLGQMGEEYRMRLETAIRRGIAFGACDNKRLARARW